ncbi:hypothetical protein VZ94_20965 [Methylocucumis oryzae]|uniref:Uncharacterized protein n=1 Tax=Methylocucumis oryzae TaxID=1632867 RepID=A0A0F3IE75_9GAMM|nr:hypothetical protein VZ94_20965 [Methylocucumis oryzae]
MELGFAFKVLTIFTDKNVPKQGFKNLTVKVQLKYADHEKQRSADDPRRVYESSSALRLQS